MAEDVTQDAPAAKPEVNEIASSGDGRDITLGFFGTMRPQSDTILAARGGDLRLYEELMRDDQVQSCFQQRKRAIIAAEWGVQAGAEDKASEMAADFIREQLNQIDFDGATEKMSNGLFYGYAVGECMYGRDDRNWTLKEVKVRKARRFRFDMDGGLRLLTLSDALEGELMPARKFWTYAAGADNDDDPYGLGLGHYCYWPVWFKKNAIKFWAVYLDKFGMPTAKGKYPPGASREEQAKLLAAARAVQSDAAVIFPDGMDIELLEATRSGGIDYDKFYDRMEGAISKVILSQTMTTDAKAGGLGAGAADTHMEVREEVTKSDADIICGTFNRGPVRWLTEWNFPGAATPIVYRKLEEAEDLTAASERDSKLFQIGYVPSENRIRDTYGEGYERKPQVTPPPLPGDKTGDKAEFAERQEDEPERLARDLDAVVSKSGMAMVDEIRAELEASSTFAEFQERMFRRYHDLPIDDLAAILRDGFALADLSGRADMEDGV